MYQSITLYTLNLYPVYVNYISIKPGVKKKLLDPEHPRPLEGLLSLGLRFAIGGQVLTKLSQLY